MRSHSVAHVVGMACLLLLVTSIHAKEKVLAKIDRIDPRELKVGGFVLDKDQDVAIEAVGFRARGGRAGWRGGDAWILDAQSREEIWSLQDAESERRSRYLSDYSDVVKLNKGTYEVYYATYPHSGSDGSFFSWSSDDRREFDYEDYEDASRDFEIIVRGEGKALSERDIAKFHKELTKGALLSVTGLGKNHYQKTGLSLERPLDLQVYAIGELRKDEFYDCSWIIDANTREKVWEFNYWDSDPAGGARKNRVFKDTISLPAGEYAMFCVSDDSHYFDGWNSQPPYDPYFWGITIQTADASMGKYAKVHEYEDMPAKNVIVELTGLGDNEYRSAGFSIARDTKVRIYAIGEGQRREMSDYSRIVDADNREVVWEMKARRTEHAGGATKNRAFDDVIELEKGNYVVYAVTDDSHSYRAWNASPPHDQEHWGITVLAEGDGMKHVSTYDEKTDTAVLIRLTGVGNNADKTERFTLKRTRDVSIYALGEGSRGRMYDYPWIESAETGKVVWEMSHRMTDHAGGAKKNRVFDDTIRLDAGEYIVRYESDGSHSFGRWNASPPADAFNWGITIRIAGGNK
ncbi:MAG: hypothetical protein OEN01_04590 [Candidatus Krumholzibacteria bacterium]|nr:hypothetical protein [Candidatus Krumholzibacteria bacterium]